MLRIQQQTLRHFRRYFCATATTTSPTTPTPITNSIPSPFAHVPQGPEDAILGVTIAYKADPSPLKINLGVGAYRDDNNKPFVLSAVREAERRALDRGMDMEYLPIGGLGSFVEKAVRLGYGEENEYIKNGWYVGFQAIGGTGACRMGAEFLKRFYNQGRFKVLMPDPTWANHPKIFKNGGCEVGVYKYYDKESKSLDFDGMVGSLKGEEDGSVVLLHACAHNPTGVDPNMEQWKEISDVMKEKKMLPFFDLAYQGFTSGDLDKDAAALRLFVDDGHKVVLAQSFAKNFGLYGHRVACVSMLTDSEQEAKALESQLKIIARPLYSNPPLHGARIIDEILSDKELEASWRKEMKIMAERIISMRQKLKEDLVDVGSTLNWDHIVNQHGMFCFSGLTKEQVDKLKNEHSVYLTGNGRISMAGVTSKNVYYLANAIHEVTK
eukprot:Plantae.Rhodophyta-Hildenbrandia_rubra.ctg6954.p1 GENE.Plantae.Rhodophyta-Hildenbrandia_rubra.ctg6954~~Plantae.Rhodophyta-Hildenbrandia_rubra.ctg6954.p1  ORF type:complete len:483 (+),score=93.77 Plantae.Rhodophyta-Hildenbrandia_rubra.ctg6954:136-1449(+)